MPGRFERVDRGNAMRIATVGTVLAALSTGFIDHYFSFTQVLIALFWLVFALGLHYARTPDVASSSSPSSPQRP